MHDAKEETKLTSGPQRRYRLKTVRERLNVAVLFNKSTISYQPNNLSYQNPCYLTALVSLSLHLLALYIAAVVIKVIVVRSSANGPSKEATCAS